MKKIVIAFLMICAVVQAAVAQEIFRTEIPLLAGERWWGVSVEGAPWDAGQSPEMPFRTTMLVSSGGRYLWSAEPFNADLDDDQMAVTSEYEKVEAQKAGKTLREAYLICVHKNLTLPAQLPAMEFFTQPVYRPMQYWGRVWGQDEIMEYARKVVGEGLPAGTIILPEEWASWNVPFAFQPELFPDPKAMVEELHKMGFKVMLDVPMAVYMPGRNLVTAHKNGWLTDTPIPKLNLGNDELAAEMRKGLDALRTHYGFDGYRFESKEYQDFDDWQEYNANLLSLANDVPMCEIDGAPAKPFPGFITGIPYGYETSLREVLYSLLSASLAGDIYKAASGEPEVAVEAAARFMVAALFFPVASVDYAPWEFEERKLQGQVRAALLFRASLADYMENLVKESARTGEPIVRHMEYQFPRQGFSDCEDQFMLGPKYLIAPCMDGEAKRMVRLPKGRWTDKSGKTFKGPLVTEVDCTDGFVYFTGN